MPGTYTATVDANYTQGELYDDIPCPHGDCDPTSGTPIEVSLNTVTSGITFQAITDTGAFDTCPFQ